MMKEEKDNIDCLNSGNDNEREVVLNHKFPGNDEKQMTLKDILRIFNNASVKIFVATLIAGVIGVIAAGTYYFFFAPQHSGAVIGIISFNYNGAEEGLDPFGRLLDVTKIKSPKVLDRALTELNLYAKGVTVEDVRQNITIEGIVPDDAFQRILTYRAIAEEEPSKLEEILDLFYVPTQYAVTLSIPSRFSFLSGAAGIELLTAIFHSYQIYFFEEYSARNILSTAIFSLPYEEYDYSESYKILNGQFNNILNYLVEKRNESPDFRAKSTQMSFGDIVRNINLIRDIDLLNMRALIDIRLLTKNVDFRILSYRALVAEKEMDEIIAMENAVATWNAIETYEKDSTIWFGTVGQAALEFNESSGFYDDLITRALRYEETAIRLRAEIDYHEEMIANLYNAETPGDPVADFQRQLDILHIESLIQSVSGKMAMWIDIINETVDEYMETEVLKDVTKIALLPKYTSHFASYASRLLIIIAAVTLIGFALSTIYAYLKALFK
jgi:hypothetical protein